MWGKIGQRLGGEGVYREAAQKVGRMPAVDGQRLRSTLPVVEDADKPVDWVADLAVQAHGWKNGGRCYGLFSLHRTSLIVVYSVSLRPMVLSKHLYL